MKQAIAWILCLLLLVLTVSGCQATDPSGNSSTVSESAPASSQGEESTPESSDETALSSVGEGSSPAESGSSAPAAEDPAGETSDPVVYMTTDLTSQGLVNVYEALGASPTGNIAVKLSTGEPGSNYLRTDLIGELVQSFDNPTIVECNTAYGGQRANTAMHYQVAEDHGYTAIADVDIMDENGSMTLPVEGGSNLTENYVGANFANYDYFVVLSHFKGHAMAG